MLILFQNYNFQTLISIYRISSILYKKARRLHDKRTMKTLIISAEFCDKDYPIFNGNTSGSDVNYIKEFTSPLELVSSIITINPALLVIDDDLTKPDSIEILKSIKKINKDIATVFITSNSSVEFGRNVSPLGIQYYAIKPIEKNDLAESINSIQKLLEKKIN